MGLISYLRVTMLQNKLNFWVVFKLKTNFEKIMEQFLFLSILFRYIWFCVLSLNNILWQFYRQKKQYIYQWQ